MAPRSRPRCWEDGDGVLTDSKCHHLEALPDFDQELMRKLVGEGRTGKAGPVWVQFQDLAGIWMLG